MQATTTLLSPQGRPYRSHKAPACEICRRRKIHCNVDIPSQACRFCREHGWECVVSSTKREKTAAEPPRKRQKTTEQTASKAGAQASRDRSRVTNNVAAATITSPTEPALVIANPPLAEDIEVLERYLTSSVASHEPSNIKPYSRVSQENGESIVYVPVPKTRKGFPAAEDPGRTQREIMEQVLRPIQEEVLKLYFNSFHPCFPILDEATFWDIWSKKPEHISSALMCNIYAVTILFWSKSDYLRQYARPDIAFGWNQAVAALHEDFMTPSMTTIAAALLDLSGRPSTQMMTNIGTAGRAVALSHSLGLHRNPTRWKMTESEKQLRIKLWWAILIHDHWSSLAHGTPPHIRNDFYDVDLPSLESLASSESRQEEPSNCFVNLCSLTKILGEILPLVYSLHPSRDDASREIRKIECQLDDWEATLPPYLKVEHNGSHYLNGRSNLRFCELSLRLLLARIAFRNTLQAETEARAYRLTLLRDAACMLADFVTSLQADHLFEFWLPYTAHLLVSAITTLLRCTIETTKPDAKRNCAKVLSRLVEKLRIARDVHKWDLADFCLERCSEPVSRIITTIDREMDSTELPQTAVDDAVVTLAASEPTHLALWDDLFQSTNFLDFPWDPPWNSFDDLGRTFV